MRSQLSGENMEWRQHSVEWNLHFFQWTCFLLLLLGHHASFQSAKWNPNQWSHSCNPCPGCWGHKPHRMSVHARTAECMSCFLPSQCYHGFTFSGSSGLVRNVELLRLTEIRGATTFGETFCDKKWEEVDSLCFQIWMALRGPGLALATGQGSGWKAGVVLGNFRIFAGNFLL